MNLPAYMQIVVFLREGILAGKYPDGKVPATSFRKHSGPCIRVMSGCVV